MFDLLGVHRPDKNANPLLKHCYHLRKGSHAKQARKNVDWGGHDREMRNFFFDKTIY